MPRYFFHIRHGWTVVPDEEGMEFPNLFHAEVEGYASARDLAVAALYNGSVLPADAVEVADEDGNVLSRIKVEPKYLVA
jgi:uncharacterized protein DUF6894